MECGCGMSLNRPLESVAERRVLVIGGGIGGIQAALDCAALGLPVTLIEEGPSVGGVMAQLDKTFPTNDCAMCILSPRLLEISRNPAIELVTCSRVLQIEGEAGDFRVVIHRRPRYVNISACTGCGECTRVCPVKMPDPYNQGLNQTKAIHLPFPQAVPLAAIINPQACRFFQGKKCGACIKVCPAGAINLQEQPEEWTLRAGAVIFAAGIQAASAAHIPHRDHPDVVTSLEFERMLSATGPYAGKLCRPSDSRPPEKIAFIQCVGSRDPRLGANYCSSVCCTASLKEAVMATEISGGGLQTAIFYMDLRIPGKGFERYLQQAEQCGVRLVRSRVAEVVPRLQGGIDVHFTDAQGASCIETFDLVVLAVGLKTSSQWSTLANKWGLALNAFGFIAASPVQPVQTSRPGVFVCGAAREPMDISETVTSASAAAAAASQLLGIIPRRRKSDVQPRQPAAIPDFPVRIGVFLCHCGTNIAGVLDLTTLAASLRHLDGVVHVEEKLFACSLESTKQIAEVIQTKGLNRIVVAACTPRTHEPVFREVVSSVGLNPGYVVMANVREQCAWVHQRERAQAMEKAGQLVAMTVEQAKNLPPILSQSFPIIPQALIIGGGVAGMSAALNLADQGYQCYLIEKSPCLGGIANSLHSLLEGTRPQEFVQQLSSLVLGHPNIKVYANAEVVGLKGHCGQFRSQVRWRTPVGCEELQLEHGVIIAATGGREFKPDNRYFYGEDPRVVTQLELEAQIRSDSLTLGKTPAIVMIQCVGSREPEHPYCSRVCCATAIKNAMLLLQQRPLADIAVLYRDIRAYGFKEEHYVKAKEQGVRFLPYAAQRPPRVIPRRHRALLVEVWDELLEREVQLQADLVVLSAGIEPGADTVQVAQLLGVQRTPEGFFLEAHQKLKPVEAASEGIFICGLAHSPRSLPETVLQAQAAAAGAARILSQPAFASGEYFATIRSPNCRRCLSCLAICPFGAVSLGEKGRPTIHVELCRGCGLCAAQCPAQAISMSRLTEPELEAQIHGSFFALDREKHA